MRPGQRLWTEDVRKAVDRGQALSHYWELYQEDLPSGDPGMAVSTISFWREYKRRYPNRSLEFHQIHPKGSCCEVDYKGSRPGLGYTDPVRGNYENFPDFSFPGHRQVFRLERTTSRLDGTSSRTEVVYGVTSLSPEKASPARLLSLVRGHWAIESLHWIRDVVFGEDKSATRKGAAPVFMAISRQPRDRSSPAVRALLDRRIAAPLLLERVPGGLLPRILNPVPGKNLSPPDPSRREGPPCVCQRRWIRIVSGGRLVSLLLFRYFLLRIPTFGSTPSLFQIPGPFFRLIPFWKRLRKFNHRLRGVFLENGRNGSGLPPSQKTKSGFLKCQTEDLIGRS